MRRSKRAQPALALDCGVFYGPHIVKYRVLLMAFYKDERLSLFIDGANLYTAARGLGLEIDF